MIDLIAIAILFIVIVLLLADRYFAAEQTKKREGYLRRTHDLLRRLLVKTLMTT
jgi:hypothetical protein